MSGESESRKSKKKSKHRKSAYDDDYVEKEVARAMKQVKYKNKYKFFILFTFYI